MKTSTLVGMAMMLSLLLTLPAAASDYTLEIFGNANEDDTINMQDVTYTELIILEYRDRTELADAKYDNEIDILDMTQIALIILGREKELTLLDSADRVVTVKKPLNRIVTCNRHFLEMFQALKVPKDKVVGVPDGIKRPGYDILYPEFQDVPIVAGGYNPGSAPDCEAIIGLYPDVVLLYAFYQGSDPATEVLESAGITVLRLSFNRPHIPNLFQEEVKKLGYVFGKEAEAQELLDFYEGCQNSIKEKVEGISEEDKPKVYAESWNSYVTTERYARIEIAGGRNIFPGMSYEASISVDPEEVVSQNPDIIVKMATAEGVAGYELDVADTVGMAEIREEIMSRPELQNVNAVRNGKVYVISGYIMAAGPRSGCRYFVQDAYDAKWFHPELFEDLDPKAIHQEYLTGFQELDIDLDEKGVFVHPPLVAS